MREEFFKTISDTQKFIISYKPQFILSSQREINKFHTIKCLIFSQLVEILDLLEIIGKDMDTLHKTVNNLSKLYRNKNIKDENISSKKEELWDKQFETVTRLKFEIKAIFLWLYQLKELLEHLMKKLRTQKTNHLISGETYSRLISFCEYRHKLVSHKYRLQRYYGEIMGVSPKWGDIKFSYLAALPSELPEKEINELFDRIRKYFNEKNQIRNDIPEKYKILCENLWRFSRKDRRKISSLLEKFGGSFPPIIEVARFINTLIFELIPRLSQI
ncbi:MAG: hypothetical protein QXM27_03025 [Candidatus Pacearchaeota archaeon]